MKQKQCNNHGTSGHTVIQMLDHESCTVLQHSHHCRKAHCSERTVISFVNPVEKLHIK